MYDITKQASQYSSTQVKTPSAPGPFLPRDINVTSFPRPFFAPDKEGPVVLVVVVGRRANAMKCLLSAGKGMEGRKRERYWIPFLLPLARVLHYTVESQRVKHAMICFTQP